MNRFSSFVLGILVGCALMYSSLKYHLVRAEDGFHLVPKVTSDFADAYVDIRKFKADDWKKHGSLAAALVNAKKGDLIAGAAESSIRDTVETVFDRLRGKTGS